MSVLVLAGFLSLLIGGVLGLLGGGGGILVVPVLVYVVGVGTKSAIAASLFLVGTTSLLGTAIHARAGQVRWKLGSIFGAASMAGAFLGGILAAALPERALLGGLAAVMLITALAMLRGRVEAARPLRPPALGRVLAIGASVGVVSGLVGAGGGFLIVPALTIFGGLAMQQAIATSLFIIALQSFAGFSGHISHVRLDWRLIAVMTGTAIIGMVAGSALGRRVSAQALKQGFTWLVFGTGLFVLGRQLPLLWTALVAAVVLAAALYLTRRRAALGDV